MPESDSTAAVACPMVPAQPKSAWQQRAVRLIILISVMASVAVFVRRGAAAWQAGGIPPGVAITTGCEEESLFALWRAAHGRPVYVDTSRIPFASAYFNWLFYAAYSTPLRVVIAAAGDAAIPRGSRIITALGAVAGAVVLLQLLRWIWGGHTAFATALAMFVYFGPLVGWWAHTARPDVGALALETAGLAALLRWHRPYPWRATITTLACFFAAWSFKQSYLLGLTTAFLFLMWRRQWRHAVALGVGSIALWAIIFLALGAPYRALQQQVALANVFYPGVGWENLRSTVEKTFPLLVLALAALGIRTPPTAPAGEFAADARTLGVIGLMAGVPMVFAASCKLGASTNYFFSIALLLVIAGAGGFALGPPRRLQLLVAAMAMTVQLAAWCGWAGRVDLDVQTRSLARRWQVFSTLPEPRFSSDARLELPWLNPASPPFVLAFNYGLDREAGRKFEAGGIAGLIESGYFASLLLPEETTTTFLGGKLTRYRRTRTVDGMTPYLKSREAATAP